VAREDASRRLGHGARRRVCGFVHSFGSSVRAGSSEAV
jgi:hypothetical protein